MLWGPCMQPLSKSVVHSISLFIAPQISKSNVVDDMVESNHVLYDEGEKPDHVVSQCTWNA